MNVCAITMVYRDYFALTQWVRHYSSQLGIENLYIVAHGHDPKVNEIAAGANIWTVPRDNLEKFDRRRNWMLNKFQSGLLRFYNWVIRTDADELICVDPQMHGNIRQLLESQHDDAVFSMGLNLFEAPNDSEIDRDTSVFDQRDAAVISGHYSKAWAVKEPIPLVRHGVAIATDGKPTHSYAFPKGVYLVHLKFSSMQELTEVNETRTALGRTDLPGMPGLAWQRAGTHAKKFFETAESLQVQPWSKAVSDAYDIITSDMKFSDNDGVIRSPGIHHIARTTLPEWFKTVDGSDQ
ncbi:glycosyltransferase family 2 protein [uncultured Tateyamaria sp.]|uniref:glycosyltransferase family 2 protein n=2 Tax=uncultured Tateyamaria sp. TaxID=455651 RepID=UPI0026339012|nr:glycosyltransferase family 2 protein [uncultured Tateyamaria sp.]